MGTPKDAAPTAICRFVPKNVGQPSPQASLSPWSLVSADARAVVHTPPLVARQLLPVLLPVMKCCPPTPTDVPFRNWT